MIDARPAAGCALHLTHATMNFGVNAGRAGELLALIDDGAGRRRRHHPRHLPVPAGLHHPGGAAAAAGRPRAARTLILARLRGRRRARSGSAYALEVEGSRRLPRRARRLGHHRDQRGAATRRWRGRSAARSPQLAADRGPAPIERLLRPAASATGWHHDPAARRPRGERARDHAAPRAHRRQRRHPVGAKPHPRAGAPSRATWATTSASWACSAWRSASRHLTGRPAARLQAAATAAWSPSATRRIWCCSTRRRSRTGDLRRAAAPRPASHVFVNGVAAIADGAPTGARAGRALRRTPHGTAPSGD